MPVLEPGGRFPEIALTDEGGAPFPRPRGEAIYAVFKTTCPTCEFTWPFLDRIRKASAGAELEIVAVSQDDPAATRDFGRRLGTDLPTAYDRQPWPASHTLGVENVPTLFHVRADGTVAETVVGFDRSRLERISDRAAQLAGRAPAPLFRPDERVPPLKPG